MLITESSSSRCICARTHTPKDRSWCFFRYQGSRPAQQWYDRARQAGNTCRPRQMTSVLVNIHWILLSYGGQSRIRPRMPCQPLNTVHPLNPSTMAGLEINLKIIRDNRCLCGQTTVQSVFKQKKKKKGIFLSGETGWWKGYQRGPFTKRFLISAQISTFLYEKWLLDDEWFNLIGIFILFLCYSSVWLCRVKIFSHSHWIMCKLLWFNA